MRVGRIFATMYNEQGEVGKLYEEIIRYKICTRKILLLMMSGIFFMGCADNTDESEAVYQASTIPIAGTEISVDLDGDGKEIKSVEIRRYDDLAKDGTRLIANVNGADVAIKDYETYVYGSTITTGDLSGDGKADVLWDRYIFGSNFGAVTISILHLEDTGWVEYPNNFIYNPNIDLEQPDGFGGQEMYIGATLFEKDGKTMVRFISLLEDNINGDTMKCTEVSYRKDGWYIEDVRLIDNYYRDGKRDELLAPQAYSY